MGTITVASAQSSSPFAKKNKAQAWETLPDAPAPSLPPVSPTPVPAPVLPAPVNVPSSTPLDSYEYRGLNQTPNQTAQPAAPQAYQPLRATPTKAPNWQEFDTTVQQKPPAEAGVYYPGRKNGGKTRHNIGTYESSSRSAQSAAPQTFSQNSQSTRQASNRPAAASPQNYSNAAYGNPNQPDWGAYQLDQSQSGQYQDNQPQYSQAQYQGGQGQPYQRTDAALGQAPKAKRSWKDRLGLGKLQTIFRGSATVGAAAVENPNGDGGWDAEFIGDADLELEVSAITQGGLEYGAVIGGRAQYDRFRRGFGQRLPDCLPTALGCSTANINGEVTGLRGHTSQFFSDGEDDSRAEEAQLETAYLFLRSAYGDVTLGRDDGAAYLFSLGAPSLLKVGASNSPVDYTGFDSVKTINDASGFAEKVTYTSPRLLGDTVGVGVQFGVSYAPNAEACGVDYCVRSNNNQGSGTIAADLRNVVEVGVAFDRNFGNGLKAELTGSYSRADERSGFAGLDDLEAFNAGLELSYNDWILGGSYLNSNNGLSDGDYEAYDVGLTWKPSRLGFTLGYGHATDDNVNLSSDQGVFGVSYDFDNITIGAGVQYIDRTTSVFDGVGVARQSEDATAIFIETGFKF
ncbi:MAG: porin [Litorimonas sp.]